jgi:hypothetical protein
MVSSEQTAWEKSHDAQQEAAAQAAERAAEGSEVAREGDVAFGGVASHIADLHDLHFPGPPFDGSSTGSE